MTTSGTQKAPYAVFVEDSRGRRFTESPSSHRDAFQRDRDRIIHSSAFRRLKHKTQVFLEHVGDYYRTRLTHSLEVAQVARTMAVALGLNEDLAETIALAHDLGHTPFGHTGEDALNALMHPFGGFDHNAQAIRIVTALERHYAEFDGLNLTWETLEGIAKHNGPVGAPVPYALAEADQAFGLELQSFASLEAQVAALSDDIAYTHHDLQDGLRAGLFTEEDLQALPVLGACFAAVDTRYPSLAPERRRHEALRRFFGTMVEDVLTTTRAAIATLKPHRSADIRGAGRQMVRFSDPLWRDLREIRSFLFARMYRAPHVVEMRKEVTTVIENLFPLYLAQPQLLPAQWHADVERARDETQIARLVADYIAGMTDGFALSSHEEHFGAGVRARLGHLGR